MIKGTFQSVMSLIGGVFILLGFLALLIVMKRFMTYATSDTTPSPEVEDVGSSTAINVKAKHSQLVYSRSPRADFDNV